MGNAPMWRRLPATPEQISHIRRLCQELNIDAYLPPGLSRGDASDTIDELKTREVGRAQGVPPLVAVHTNRRNARAYNEGQLRQFAPRAFRPAIAGRAGPRVWKQFPNVMTGSGMVRYGWSWRCWHPDHRTPPGSNNARYSFETAIDKADAHARRFHS